MSLQRRMPRTVPKGLSVLQCYTAGPFGKLRAGKSGRGARCLS